MESIPQLWIVAGPNGAGKTTCVQKEPIASILPDVRFLNPDDRSLLKLQAAGFGGFADAPEPEQTRCFIDSANEVYAEVHAELIAGRSVGVETVLSSEKYRPLVNVANESKGVVGLIYIALRSPSISSERIADRVRRGGHSVPESKLPVRWQRSLDNLAWFARRATVFWVVDNSESNADAPSLIATGKQGRIELLCDTAFPELKTALSSLPKSV